MNNKITIRLALMACLLTASILNSCGKEPVGPSEVDKIAPAAIADLTIDSVRSGITYISWTATGDDGSSGTASAYDIRYTADSVALAAWSGAAQIAHSLKPAASGANEELAVPLAGGDFHHIAIKAIDEAGNKSSASNMVHSASGLEIADMQTSGSGCASVIVPILSYNCDTIAGVELHIQFSGGVVTFDSLKSALLNDELVNMSDGTIHVAWANINDAIPPLSGDTLALLYFSNLTGICNLTFGTGCELVNREAETLPVIYNNGSMKCE
ncbi:MAG: hypothetical protein NT002_00150 [candidate division Zixibacteria bacterium]|nr:hypothetical protein [candidate division Zixibacteria bacterium]